MKKIKAKQKQKKAKSARVPAPLSEIDLIFKTLDERDFCIKSSKQYLNKISKNAYNCSLCKVTISRPKKSYERRFNIWLHIHDNTHRSLLPNYNTVLGHVPKILKDLSEKEPNLKEDLNCFDLGPFNHLVLCCICQCVIRCKEHAIKTHLEDRTHLANKVAGGSEIVNAGKRNEEEFLGLIKSLPEELKDDKKYIEKGCFPGYVICSLCSRYIISTPFYLKSHINHFWHQSNKDNPFHLPEYSRQLPNPLIPMSSRLVTTFDMKFFFSVVKSDDPLIKDNAKYLSKQHGKTIYYCELCNCKLCGNRSDTWFKIVADHFQEEEHMKNKSSPSRFKLNQSRFAMFDNIPEEVYEDIQFFEILPLKGERLSLDGEVFCHICKYSLLLDLTVFIDHIESKQHVKHKIMLNLTTKLNKLSIAIDEVFDQMSSRDEKIKSMRQYFDLNNDCSKIVCKLCNTIVGNTENTLIDLEQLFLRHLRNERHMHHSQEPSCSNSGSNPITKSTLKEMFKAIPNLDKTNKNVIVSSKRPGHLKCKVCNSRFLADIEKLKNHMGKKNHKKQVEMWKEENAVATK